MKKTLLSLSLLLLVCTVAACVNRMAPFAPHRTNTDAHRSATSNQACSECHDVTALSSGHQASDDCLHCHRIVQGD